MRFPPNRWAGYSRGSSILGLVLWRRRLRLSRPINLIGRGVSRPACRGRVWQFKWPGALRDVLESARIRVIKVDHRGTRGVCRSIGASARVAIRKPRCRVVHGHLSEAYDGHGHRREKRRTLACGVSVYPKGQLRLFVSCVTGCKYWLVYRPSREERCSTSL